MYNYKNKLRTISIVVGLGLASTAPRSIQDAEKAYWERYATSALAVEQQKNLLEYKSQVRERNGNNLPATEHRTERSLGATSVDSISFFSLSNYVKTTYDSMFRQSVRTNTELVACIGDDGTRNHQITRILPLKSEQNQVNTADFNSAKINCVSPKWIGTVHTHPPTDNIETYATEAFSGNDIRLNIAMRRTIGSDALFCVIFQEGAARCSEGYNQGAIKKW